MALIISISDSISSVVTSRRGAAGTFIVTESGDFITTEFGAFIIPESLACKSLDFDG